MTFIDWTIIAVFLIGLTLIGFLFSKSNRNLEDYFLGGRSMPTWLVAFAATGTSISAGTFVGSPELGFNTNLTYLMLCVGAILGGTLVALLVLPKLYNANTITIYGYLGDRFGDSAKNSSSVMFLVGQLFTSGSRLFIAAIAVSVILYGSIQFEFLMYSIIILGVVSTVYTMAGGIKGLIYIDTIQIMLVIGTGVVALLFIYFSMTPHMSLGDIFATLASGEVKNAAGEWVAGNKLQIVDASWRMDVPYNLMGALVGCTIFKFAQFSTDHEFVQRQLTCKSVKKAGVSLVYSQILSLPIVLIFLSIGLLFYVSYSTSADPAAIMQYKNDARDIFPHDPDGRAGHYGHRPAGRRAVEFQLGDQRHGQQLRRRHLHAAAQAYGTCDHVGQRPDVVVEENGGAHGDRAHRFCDRHGRHAGEERAEPGRFRHGRDELLLRRDARRLPVRAFHRTGQYAERRRGARRRPAGRPVAATLCARPVERMARRPPHKHRVAVVVPDRRCRQLRRLLPRQEEK